MNEKKKRSMPRDKSEIRYANVNRSLNRHGFQLIDGHVFMRDTIDLGTRTELSEALRSYVQDGKGTPAALARRFAAFGLGEYYARYSFVFPDDEGDAKAAPRAENGDEQGDQSADSE
jgi:hypothetical protein